MNTENCKELLIEITTELIRESKGEINKVTIREISKRSNVSVGLINYHFKNKENLIAICVQRIIVNVISLFKPDTQKYEKLSKLEAGEKRLINSASLVFEFLFAHPEISKISILNDYENYLKDTNSWASISGFSRIINDAIEDQNQKEKISFYLVNSMQIAFLKSLNDPVFLGYDFKKEEDRKMYIRNLVKTLFEGAYEIKNI